jgi:hypothetical protein
LLLAIDIDIAANDITASGVGIETATNRVTFLFPGGYQMLLPL